MEPRVCQMLPRRAVSRCRRTWLFSPHCPYTPRADGPLDAPQSSAMVVLVDLDDADDGRFPLAPPATQGDDDSRPNPNVNGFSAALSCYP
jgi:hypothetical protein